MVEPVDVAEDGELDAVEAAPWALGVDELPSRKIWRGPLGARRGLTNGPGTHRPPRFIATSRKAHVSSGFESCPISSSVPERSGDSYCLLTSRCHIPQSLLLSDEFLSCSVLALGTKYNVDSRPSAVTDDEPPNNVVWPSTRRHRSHRENKSRPCSR